MIKTILSLIQMYFLRIASFLLYFISVGIRNILDESQNPRRFRNPATYQSIIVEIGFRRNRGVSENQTSCSRSHCLWVVSSINLASVHKFQTPYYCLARTKVNRLAKKMRKSDVFPKPKPTSTLGKRATWNHHHDRRTSSSA